MALATRAMCSPHSLNIKLYCYQYTYPIKLSFNFIRSGWGTLFYGGPHSTVLLEVTVPVWNQQKCADAFVDSIFDETICAGGHEGGKDACQVIYIIMLLCTIYQRFK